MIYRFKIRGLDIMKLSFFYCIFFKNYFLWVIGIIIIWVNVFINIDKYMCR